MFIMFIIIHFRRNQRWLTWFTMLFHAVPGSDKLWAADNRMAALITFTLHNWFFFNPHTSLVYHRAIRQKPNTKRKRFIGGEFLPLKVHSRWPVPSFKVHLGTVSVLKMQRYTLKIFLSNSSIRPRTRNWLYFSN